MLTLDFVGTNAVRHGISVLQLHEKLWRVTLPAGDVLGYIELLPVANGIRYRAKRFLPRQRRFLLDGEFWAMDDAIDCFRAF